MKRKTTKNEESKTHEVNIEIIVSETDPNDKECKPSVWWIPFILSGIVTLVSFSMIVMSVSVDLASDIFMYSLISDFIFFIPIALSSDGIFHYEDGENTSCGY